jgi:lipopolysaccharide/colanic/teichoic acid biosynthesis glycosyltransferase
MRLIGPRPERPEIVAVLEASVPDYRSRLVVCPGVTGLAQILLPADTAIDCVRRKLELDRAYIAGQGWGMDARILVGTVLYLAGLRADRIARCLGLPAPPPPTGDVG